MIGGLPRSDTMPKLRSEVDEEIGVPVSIHTKRGSKPETFLRVSDVAAARCDSSMISLRMPCSPI